MDMMIAIACAAVFGLYALVQRSRRIDAEDEAQTLREELADVRRAALPPTVSTRGAGGGGRR